ncbi:MAG: pseudouridine synthase [Candidatus Thiodiazotropha sp.]
MSRTKAPLGERLQKVLANAGLGSRREIEGWISAGKVEVNGSLAQLGQRVVPTDSIKVDGRKVSVKRLEPPEREVLVFNKPEGELVTRHDPEGRRTVFDHLPKLKHGRWVPIGRLDINSTGLLLLTTDGELANQLMHPSRQVEREYAVRVMGEVTEAQLEQLVHGVELDDGPARFEEIVESGGEGINRWFHVVIMEGRQREVRRMWEAVGAKVNRLKRVRYGSVMLDSALKAGRWRYLNDGEIDELLKTLGLKSDKPRNRPAARGKQARDGRPAKGEAPGREAGRSRSGAQSKARSPGKPAKGSAKGARGSTPRKKPSNDESSSPHKSRGRSSAGGGAGQPTDPWAKSRPGGGRRR